MSLLSAFDIFNPSKMSSNIVELANYGVPQLNTLLDHYGVAKKKHVLSDDGDALESVMVC